MNIDIKKASESNYTPEEILDYLLDKNRGDENNTLGLARGAKITAAFISDLFETCIEDSNLNEEFKLFAKRCLGIFTDTISETVYKNIYKKYYEEKI
jgi:hypothetical protein